MVDFTNPQGVLSGQTAPDVSSPRWYNLVLVIPGLIGTFLLGYAYMWLLKIPFTCAAVLSAMGYAAAAAWLVSKIYSSVRCKSALLVIILALLFAVVLNYANWFWFIFDANTKELIWDPADMLEIIDEIADVRKITLGRRGTVVTGDLLCGLYAVEVLFLTGALLWTLRQLRLKEYFCPKCSVWVSESLKIPDLDLTQEAYDRLAAGEADLIARIPRRSGDGARNIVFILCPTCGSARMSVEEVKVDKKKRRSTHVLSSFKVAELAPGEAKRLLDSFSARPTTAS